MAKKYLSLIFVFLTIAAFGYFKISHLTFRFGDSNAYFYMAQMLLEGKLPYRDFFLADPPFLVFVLAGIKALFASHLLVLQAVPILLESLTAFLLYAILRKSQAALAFLAPLIYLFSFSVLSTSDFVTGVQLVVFLFVMAIFLWEQNLPFASGVFWALSFLTKLYTFPAFIGFCFYVFWQGRKKDFLKLVLGAVSAAVLILGPLAISAFQKMVDFLLLHHLNRPAGLSKTAVFQFFVQKEWLILISSAIGIFFSKKKILVFPFAFTLIFLLLFQDLYYTYLGALLPYLVIFAVCFLGWFWQRSGGNEYAAIFLLGLGGLFLFLSVSNYQNDLFSHGRFLNAPEIAGYVRALPENFDLYGSHEVAPLIALLSGKKLFKNYIDTNPQVFAAKTVDLKAVSQEATEKKVYLLARITDLPDYGIKNFGYEGFFDKEIFEESCQMVKEFPSTSKEQDNFIRIFKCQNNKGI